MKKYRVLKYETVVFAYKVIAPDRKQARCLVESKELSENKKFLSGRLFKEKYKVREVEDNGSKV